MLIVSRAVCGGHNGSTEQLGQALHGRKWVPSDPSQKSLMTLTYVKLPPSFLQCSSAWNYFTSHQTTALAFFHLALTSISSPPFSSVPTLLRDFVSCLSFGNPHTTGCTETQSESFSPTYCHQCLHLPHIYFKCTVLCCFFIPLTFRVVNCREKSGMAKKKRLPLHQYILNFTERECDYIVCVKAYYLIFNGKTESLQEPRAMNTQGSV